MTDNQPAVRSSGPPTPRTGEQVPELSGPAVVVRAEPAPPPDQLPDVMQSDERAEPRRVSTLTKVLVVLGVGLLAIGITQGPAVGRILSQKDAVLATPDEAAGLTRLTDADALETADYLVSLLAANIDLDEYAGAIYTEPGGAITTSVMLFGGTAFLLRPEAELDAVFTALHEAGPAMALEDVDPGSLGGVMKCGTGESTDGRMSICGWADHGSIAFAFFPNRTTEESATLLRTLRPTVLSR